VEPGRIIVEQEVPVFPPAEYLEPCEAEPVSRLDLVIERLSELVDCERADKAALRAWIEERQP
jgi:hypothetical protein